MSQVFSNELRKWSNPEQVIKMAKKYFKMHGHKMPKLEESTLKNKKYMIFDGNKWIHFGQKGYEDFTKHKDVDRRKRYLARSTKIKGDWKNNILSPNNLSINILW